MSVDKNIQKTIWAVGGGKGGTGKSFLSANLAIELGARQGDVIIIDADLGGPNLHTLLAIREKRGISLEQIAGDCKISLSSLQALEEEDCDALPNGKDFHRLLNLYAKCLGLDSENGRE